MAPSSPPQSYLIIGGSGFLGRHIVETLQRRGERNVSTFDMVQRYHDVPHFSGDITNGQQIGDAINKSSATVIIHTASPVHNLTPDIYYKVNVLGTLTVVKAAIANKVPCLVYTSSSGVVDAGINLIDADERLPYPDKFVDAYNESKALAEKIVLEANGRNGLLTVALRPAGIFGPGDRQVTTGYARALLNHQTHFQVGNNDNMFDMTYIDNVVHAHILAADRLAECSKQSPSEWVLQDAVSVMDIPIGYSKLTVGDWSVPTSAAKPLGPVGDRPLSDEEKQADALFRAKQPDDAQYVTRTKLDPMSENAQELEATVVSAREIAEKGEDGQPASPFIPETVTWTEKGTSLPHPSSVLTPNLLQVPGQAFFITNGEPVYFWDFSRMMWKEMGDQNTRKIVMPVQAGLVLGTLAEWFSWFMGREPGFSRYRVAITSSSRWFNIEKARRVLGYEPQVGIEEGIKRTIKWFNETGGLASLPAKGH